jgi:hypothetical protein
MYRALCAFGLVINRQTRGAEPRPRFQVLLTPEEALDPWRREFSFYLPSDPFMPGIPLLFTLDREVVLRPRRRFQAKHPFLNIWIQFCVTVEPR